jgi:hypothetical protein
MVRQWLKLLSQLVNTLASKRWRRLQKVRHRAQPPRSDPHLMDIFDIAVIADRFDEIADPRELRSQGFQPDPCEWLSA